MNQSNRSSLVIGLLLVAAGLIFLAEQVFHINIAGFTWPLIIVAFGAAFFVGMLLGGKTLGGLAVPGSIITGVGLILLVQNTLNLWESWSYAWALVICFVGIGLLIYGSYSGLPSVKASGWRTLRVGTILFLIFGGIFGFFFSLTGAYGNKASLFWAVALIIVGLVMGSSPFTADTVRAGLQSVSKGQIEAAHALGLSGYQTMRLVIIPQAMRVIVPPMTSNYLSLTKNSSLASAIAFPEIVHITSTITSQTGRAVEIMTIVMAIYATLSLLTSLFMNWYNNRIRIVER